MLLKLLFDYLTVKSIKYDPGFNANSFKHRFIKYL